MRRAPLAEQRRQRILEVLQEIARSGGMPPTLREIAERVGESKSTIFDDLKRLQEAGALRWPGDPDRYHHKRRGARMIQLIDQPTMQEPSVRLVPLRRSLRVSEPSAMHRSGDELLALPPKLVGTGDLYILEVQTDSMIPDLLPGDLIVVREQSSAEDRDLVIVVLEDGAEDGEPLVSIKYLELANGKSWLRAANPAYQRIAASNARVLGVVVASLRKYQPSSPPGGSSSVDS